MNFLVLPAWFMKWNKNGSLCGISSFFRGGEVGLRAHISAAFWEGFWLRWGPLIWLYWGLYEVQPQRATITLHFDPGPLPAYLLPESLWRATHWPGYLTMLFEALGAASSVNGGKKRWRDRCKRRGQRAKKTAVTEPIEAWTLMK